MGAACSCEKSPENGSGNTISQGPRRPVAARGNKQSTASAPRDEGAKAPELAPEPIEVVLEKVKAAIKAKYKTRKEAFQKTDCSQDARIDRLEFQRFLLDDIEFSRADEIDRIFEELDQDRDGVISPVEFKVLFDEEIEDAEEAKVAAETAAPKEVKDTDTASPLLKEFREQLRSAHRSWREAFDRINASKSSLIDKQEFLIFVKREIGIENTKAVASLFDEIDEDRDGYISPAEFKTALGKNATEVAAFQADDAPKPSLRRRDSTVALGDEAAQKPALRHRGSSATLGATKASGQRDKRQSADFASNESSASSASKKSFAARARRSSTTDLNNTRKGGLQHFKEFMKNRFAGAKEAFAHLDKDNDKQIDLQELKQVLLSLNFDGSAEEVFADLDKNNDGFVSCEEFKQQLKTSMRRSSSVEQPCAAAGA